MQVITGVDRDSIAEELGIAAGDHLLSINGENVLDIVDYEYLCANEQLELVLRSAHGEIYEAEVEKELVEPLGLNFASGLMSEVRTCKNKCVFCFIDQMPKGGRKSLEFKDDDWRMSFIMGNYISLTNVDDREFERILKRRVSPLYISVHATDPVVRRRMMCNKTAGLLMDRLHALYGAGLSFHSQIVCCPGLNDGEILEKTLRDLYTLYPLAVSVAIVPVGLTKFRDGLFPLRMLKQEEAKHVLRQVEAFNARTIADGNGQFVYASDEMVLQAGEALPPYESYGDFPQIENGVGLLRLFEREFSDALEERKPLIKPFVFEAAGGVMANPFFVELFKQLRPYNIEGRAHAIINDYFGHDVTVGGLITGQDLVKQLRGKLTAKHLFLPHNMLREQEDVFLDGMRVHELQKELGVEIVPVRGEGEKWVDLIFRYAEYALSF